MFLKNSKKILASFQLSAFSFQTFLLFMAMFALWIVSGSVQAQEAKVDYKNEIVMDSDFDGLTDQGEIQIYYTDPNNPDTDGDGFYDGAEILRGTDPLSVTDPINFQLADQIKEGLASETPWAWYVTRSAGILGFIFLWFSVFIGLSIRNNWLKKIINPIYSFDFHCFLGASALFWAFIHGLSIIFDKFFGMKMEDIIIPFHFKYANWIAGGINYLALGIIAFYLIVVLVFTSYFKKFISHKIWRLFHFLNPIIFIFVVSHGYFIGTDMHNIWIKNIFLGSSLFLLLVYVSNLFFVFWNNWRKNDETENPNQG